MLEVLAVRTGISVNRAIPSPGTLSLTNRLLNLPKLLQVFLNILVEPWHFNAGKVKLRSLGDISRQLLSPLRNRHRPCLQNITSGRIASLAPLLTVLGADALLISIKDDL